MLIKLQVLLKKRSHLNSALYKRIAACRDSRVAFNVSLNQA
jgi:hypothetical protein